MESSEEFFELMGMEMRVGMVRTRVGTGCVMIEVWKIRLDPKGLRIQAIR